MEKILPATSDPSLQSAHPAAFPIIPRRVPRFPLNTRPSSSLPPSVTTQATSSMTQMIPPNQHDTTSDATSGRPMVPSSNIIAASHKRPWTTQAGRSESTGLSQSQEAQVGFNSIKLREDEMPQLLRLAMDARERALASVQKEAVNQALYGLLNAPGDVPCLSALAHLARTLNLEPSSQLVVVDHEGNPFSEHILTFVDTILVMYRSLATVHIPLLEGSQDNKLNDATDQAAFGALTATTSASRLLILISHAHHHVVRALWFGLLYLSMAYRGTKRGVAVDFLLEAVQQEWYTREENAKAEAKTCWGGTQKEMDMEEEWYRRARSVGRLWKKYRTNGGLWLGTVWAEMKGMVQVQSGGVGEEDRDALPTEGPPQQSSTGMTSPDGPRNGDDTPLGHADIERGLGGAGRVRWSPDA